MSEFSKAIFACAVLAFLEKLLKIGTFKLTPKREDPNHCWSLLKNEKESEKA